MRTPRCPTDPHSVILEVGRRHRSAVAETANSSHARGVVLIVVLVLVVMVALAGFGFLNAMSVEYAATRLNGDQLQSRQTLASAEAMLLQMISFTPAERARFGGTRNNSVLFRGRLVEPLAEDSGRAGGAGSAAMVAGSADSLLESGVPDARWRFSIVSVQRTLEGQRLLRFGLENESARLNLASVLRWEQGAPGTGRNALMQFPGMTETSADAILDWIDEDDQPREFGAESEFYLQLDQPYRPANALPRTISELLFVRGVSRQNLLGISATDGTGTDGTGTKGRVRSPVFPPQVPSSGQRADRANLTGPDLSMADRGWQDYLTLHSAERNVDVLGRPRIHLNAESLSQLEQDLMGFLPEDLVRFILLARVHGLSAVVAGGAVSPTVVPFDSAMAPGFLIPAPEALLEASVQMTTPAGSIIVGSPLRDSMPDFQEVLQLVLDRTTATAAESVSGRINVNDADELVLRAIPGMLPELASQIVSQRQTLEQQDRRTIAWLVTRGVLTSQQFRQLAPALTAGGDVYRGEVIVFRGIGGPVLRRQLILDGSTSFGRRLDWEDFSDAASPWPISVLMPSAGDAIPR